MPLEWLPSRLPIIQAPMAGSQGVELCVAVSEAGGLGSLPSAMLTAQTLRERLALRGREKLEARFGWDGLAEQVEEVTGLAVAASSDKTTR